VDVQNSRIYVTYTAANGQSLVRAFSYDGRSHTVAPVWQSTGLAGTIGTPVLSSDYSRLYVQTDDGLLRAFDTASGGVIWSFDLGVPAAGTPAVSDFGYIMPGLRQSDSASVDYVGIVQDNGSSAAWVFQSRDFAANSQPAVGRQNRFAVMANRASDGALVLLVVSPKFGVMSQTPVTIGPTPPRITAVSIDQQGWIYAGTWGASVYRAFSPLYATTVQ
jgi:outer membrane protein assembly factor BamB